MLLICPIIKYIAVAMLGIFTGDLIDSMLNVQAVDGVYKKLGCCCSFSLVTLLLKLLLSLFGFRKSLICGWVASSEV